MKLDNFKYDFGKHKQKIMEQRNVGNYDLISGKAKEDFISYLKKEMYHLGNGKVEDCYNDLGMLFKTSLIVEWLDTVGINISVSVEPTNSVHLEDEESVSDNDHDFYKDKYSCAIFHFTQIVNGVNDYKVTDNEQLFDTRQSAINNGITYAGVLYNSLH